MVFKDAERIEHTVLREPGHEEVWSWRIWVRILALHFKSAV